MILNSSNLSGLLSVWIGLCFHKKINQLHTREYMHADALPSGCASAAVPAARTETSVAAVAAAFQGPGPPSGCTA